jgi:hypothetical protein
MIKALKKLGIEEVYLNIIQSLLNKPMANVLNGKTETISSKMRNERRGRPLSPLLFDIVFEFLARAMGQEK